MRNHGQVKGGISTQLHEHAPMFTWIVLLYASVNQNNIAELPHEIVSVSSSEHVLCLLYLLMHYRF